MKKYLITGSTGFVGNHLVNRLLKDVDNKIFCMDMNIDDELNLKKSERIEFIKGNILDRNFAQSAIFDISPDFIVHLAARKNRTNSILDYSESINVNILGTLNILKASLYLNNLKRIVLLGTAEEYGNVIIPFRENGGATPFSAYGISKLTSTLLGLSFWNIHNVPTVVLRPTIAYGPGQGVEMFISSLISTLIKGKKFEMSFGEQSRNFIYIDDLISSILLALRNNNCCGEIINIGSARSYKLEEVARLIERKLGLTNRILFGAKRYRDSEIMNYDVDINKARELLGWSTEFEFERGIDETINYFIDLEKKNI